ncbi:MAG TPA: GNAT family N-acetyltransferase [Ktedonobacteraceae bacterium]
MNNHEEYEQCSFSAPAETLRLAPEELASIWFRVQTSRLILRRLQPTDGPAMFRIHGDPQTNQYNPAGPHPDLATSEEMLRDCLQYWNDFGFGYWAVTLVQQEAVLGFGGVEHRFWRGQEVLNLYYRFTPGAWGQGYATELAQTAVTLARKHLPQWPVVVRTRTKNLASQQVALRAGLLRRSDLEGEHVVFVAGSLF